MKVAKRIGVWMDHSVAHFMEFSETPKEIETIESNFSPEEKEKVISKGESHLHNKEQQMQREFYKKIGAVILNYDKVLLFGPTDAKTELFNHLREDHRFANIRINVKDSDKMSLHQRQAFINEHFSSPLYN